MKISDLKFKQKFIFAFGVIILCFLISSVLTLINLKELIKSAENNNQGHELREKLKQMYVDHLLWSKKVSLFFIENKVKQIDVQTDDHQCNFGKWLYSKDRENAVQIMPELATYFNKIENPHHQLHQSIIDINNILQSNDTLKFNKAKEIFTTKTEINLNEVVGIIEEIIAKSNEITISDEAVYQKQNDITIQLIIFTIISIVISLIFASMISNNVTKSIHQGLKFVDSIAKGDLTTEMTINQKDEIGQLASSLKAMVEKLKTIVSDILQGAENISSASSEISSTAQQMSQGANEQASSVEEVSSSMEQMSSNIEQNTENSQQTDKIATKAAEEIIQGNLAVNETVVSMKTIAEKISIISEIAFQTNILALNAAVEAARAGEHGKGFAVVAAEVRKLAERSQIAAKEIDTLTKTSVVIAERTGKLFLEIVPSIQNTARLVQEITSSSIEQNNGTNQINSAIQQLNQISQQNAAASEELATNAEEMTSQAEQLQDIVSYFKVDSQIKRQQTKQIKKQQTKFAHMNLQQNISKGINLNLNDKRENDYETF